MCRDDAFENNDSYLLFTLYVLQEDQLGLSLLTLEQLQSEEMLQKISQIAQQA